MRGGVGGGGEVNRNRSCYIFFHLTTVSFSREISLSAPCAAVNVRLAVPPFVKAAPFSPHAKPIV